MNDGIINYFFFLKDDSSSITQFKDHLVDAFEAERAGIDSLFKSTDEQNNSVFASKDFPSGTLELMLGFHSEVAVITAIWDGLGEEQSGFINRLASLSDGGQSAALGEATVFLGGCPSRPKGLDQSALASVLGDALFEKRQRYLCSECGLKGESLMLGGPIGTLCHMPPHDDEKHHYYLFTPAADSSAALQRQLLTVRIPALDMILRRLRQKQMIFSERRIAIESEHRAMDASVGRFFHREAVNTDALDEQRAKLLAEEIGRLSQVYAILATDAQLVKEAETSFKEELEALHRAAAVIAGRGGAVESTLVMYYDGQYGPEVKTLAAQSGALALSLERVKAAVDIVRTEVELLRGNETMELQQQSKELLRHNLAIQQERMALLVAANVVEFVVIFYYTLSSWDAIVGVDIIEGIPAYFRFLAVALLAFSGVWLTHSIARVIRKSDKSKRGLLLATMTVIIALGAIIAGTIYWT